MKNSEASEKDFHCVCLETGIINLGREKGRRKGREREEERAGETSGMLIRTA